MKVESHVEASDGATAEAVSGEPGSDTAAPAETLVDEAVTIDADAEGDADGDVIIERAFLNDSASGRQIQASFIVMFGNYMQDEVRPLLRDAAVAGENPQLLVNGLAELLRSVAFQIEFPLDHPRAGFPPNATASPST